MSQPTILPRILVLEDDRLQILSLRSQLSDIGALQEFGNPEEALAFARANRCDAAIVDVRMPKQPIDGLGFVRELKEFDREIEVILRTADESDYVIDGAIELRAIKRAIKSKTSVAELRRAALQAICQTNERRAIVNEALNARRTAKSLTEVVADLEGYKAVSALSRSRISNINRKLSALSVLTSLIRIGASDARKPLLVAQADQAAGNIKNIIDIANEYIGSVLYSRQSTAKTNVKECLAALVQIYSETSTPSSRRDPLIIRPLREDIFVPIPPMMLLAALWNIIGFCLDGRLNQDPVIVSPKIEASGEMVGEISYGDEPDSASKLQNKYIRLAVANSLPADRFRFFSESENGNGETIGEFRFTTILHAIEQANGKLTVAVQRTGSVVELLLPLVAKS